MNFKDNRYVGAALMSPFIIFLFLGGTVLKYGVMVLALLGMYEFYKVLKEKQINSISIVGYILCLVYYVTITDTVNLKVMLPLFIISIMLLLCVPVTDLKYTFIDVSTTILGFLYVAVFLSFIVLVDMKPNGNYLLWLIFIAAWLCDTTAYYVGKNFGKTKIAPKVSPKKTLEGSIGGLVGASVSCLLLGLFINSRVPGINISLYHYAFIGALCGVFCQYGDLVASSVKRYVGVKDYSHLIPGHGGILDRFDSALFSGVVVFFYLHLILGI